MQARSPIQELLRLARSRYVANQVLTQAAFGACAAVGALILLLIAGTELLDGRWMAVLFAAAFAAGLFRALRRLPSEYAVARQIDRRLELRDNLSTALYFQTASSRQGSPEFRAAQREQAEELTRRIAISAAAPFTLPRELKAVALLGAAAFGLFALRYGLSGSLDLRPPIAPVAFRFFRGSALETAAAHKALNSPRPMEPDGATAALDPAQSTSANTTEMPAAASTRPDTPAADPVRAHGKGDDSAESDPGDDSSEPADALPASERRGDADRTEKPGSAPPATSKPGGPNEDSDLMNKLKNAMADLLAKLKIQPPTTESGRSIAANQGSPNGKPRQAADRKGAPGPGKQKSGDADGAEQKSGEPGEAAENAEAVRGQPGDKGSSTPDSRRERSGIGKEDGAKDLKAAEQMAAMGKISEILGKRAQNVTGEVMVEVASSQNQLKTAYSQRNAKHSDTGGEIHRDEIPLIFQDYVQQYFEEVRKSAAPPQARGN